MTETYNVKSIVLLWSTQNMRNTIYNISGYIYFEESYKNPYLCYIKI